MLRADCAEEIAAEDDKHKVHRKESEALKKTLHKAAKLEDYITAADHTVLHCAVNFNWSETRRDLASPTGKSGLVKIHVKTEFEVRSAATPWFKCDFDKKEKRFRVQAFGNFPSTH